MSRYEPYEPPVVLSSVSNPVLHVSKVTAWVAFAVNVRNMMTPADRSCDDVLPQVMLPSPATTAKVATMTSAVTTRVANRHCRRPRAVPEQPLVMACRTAPGVAEAGPRGDRRGF